MGGSLVRDGMGLGPAIFGEFDELRHEFGGVTEESNAGRFGGLFDDCDCFLNGLGFVVNVSGFDAEIYARFLAFDGNTVGSGEDSGERLSTPHSAQARGENPLMRPIAVVMLATEFDKGFMGSLNDALASNVDPGAGGHLTVHHEAFAVEFVKVLPGCPFGHEVGICDEDSWSVGVRLEYGDGFAGLDEEGLIWVEVFEGFEDGLEAFPVAGGFADSAIDDEVFGAFGDFGVEVILNHAEGSFNLPVFACEG